MHARQECSRAPLPRILSLDSHWLDDIATGAPAFLSPRIPDLLSLVLAPVGISLDPAQHASYCPALAGPGDGIILVGAPLGSLLSFCQDPELPSSLVSFGGVEFMQKFNDSVIQKWSKGVADLAEIPDLAPGWPGAHLAFQAIHISAQVRLNYHCRVSPLSRRDAARVQTDLWQAVSKVAGLPGELSRSHIARLQADLPIAAGGLGLRDIERIAPAAFVAAWLDAVPHIAKLFGYLSDADFARAVDNGSIGEGGALIRQAIRAAAIAEVPDCQREGQLGVLLRARDDFLESCAFTSTAKEFLRKDGSLKWQKFLCRDLGERAVASFREKASREQEIWRQRAAEPGSGKHSWLLSKPRGDLLAPFLETELFRIGVRDRLFLPHIEVSAAATCQHSRRKQGGGGVGNRGEQCGQALCPHLHHAAVCHVGGLTNARHDFVAQGIFEDLQALGLRVDAEVWVPEWDRPKVKPKSKRRGDETGQEVEHARLDLRVLGRSGKVEFLDVRVFYPCSAKGKCTDYHRPEHHERDKHLRYPTQGASGQRLHPFSFSPIVFNALGGKGTMSYKALQRLAKSGPAVKRGEVLPGDIVQAAAVKVVRMSSLLKREAQLGLGLGAVAKRPGDPGIGPEPSEADSSGVSDTVPRSPVAPPPCAPDDDDARRDVLPFSAFSRTSPTHVENHSAAVGLAYTPPGSSLGVACPSPEVGRKSHAPRLVDCDHVSAAETSLKSASNVAFPTTGSSSRGQVAPFRTTSHYGSALTWSQLPGAPSWIAENSAAVSSSKSCVGLLKGV